MKLTTYLCGSIQDVKSDGGAEWRDRITPKLEALGITVLNPCKSECNKEFGETIKESREQIRKYKRSGNWDAFDSHMDKVIEDDIRQVDASDFLIVYWNQEHRHGGTIHEMAEADLKRIPIYCVNYDPLTGDKEMNDWVLRLVRRNGKMFENFGQLVDFIEEKHRHTVKEILKENTELEKARQKEIDSAVKKILEEKKENEKKQE